MSFQIRKNIPKPTEGRTKYPFENMGVGEMFFVPCAEGQNNDEVNKHRKKVSGAASMAGIRLGMKFSTAIMTEDGVIGTGVWRDS